MIFEAIGLKQEFIEKYFTGTVSRVGGIGLEEIAKDYMARHSEAFDPLGLSVDLTLNSVGQHKSKSGGEKHLYNPRTIHMLQQSTRRGDYEMFKQYTQMVDEESKGITLRGQMDFNYPKKGVPLSEVESVDSIVTRFKTGAMSYGSISQEAHETLALAMNALHGKSNSGEGGEDIERLGYRQRLCNQTGCQWTFWCYKQISCQCKRDPDQDGAGSKTWRRWTSAGRKGLSLGSKNQTFYAGCGTDLTAAASRYLLDRRSGTADL